MTARGMILDTIRRYLSIFANDIKQNSYVNRLSDNISAEDIFAGLLNLIYGYNLKNANEICRNQKSVDLLDPEGATGIGVAVQITSSNTRQKVQKTMIGFESGENNLRLCDKYRKLIILVLTFEDKFQGWNRINRKEYDVSIMNLMDLSRDIEHLPGHKLRQIQHYLRDELGISDILRKIASERPTHLLPSVPPATLSFIPGSRDKEIELLAKQLQVVNAVFLWGVGGIGKTQVAIQLAKRLKPARGSYFLRYLIPADDSKDAMRHSILQMDIRHYRFEGQDNDQHDAEYAQRMEILEQEYAGALIIIDNFDRVGKSPSDMLREEACQRLMAMDLKLVFTTRNNFGKRGLEICPISETALVQLMRRTITDENVANEDLLDLIRAVHGHTLTVDLMAKTLEESWGGLTPAQLLQALSESELNREDFHKVVNDYNNEYTQEQIYIHLRRLFDLSGMDVQQTQVLTYATLLPEAGMDARFFELALEQPAQEALRTLVACGWLQRDSNNLLSIHPVLREVCFKELKPTDDNCESFLVSLWEIYAHHRTLCTSFLQFAECFSYAANHLEDKYGNWAFSAGELWWQNGCYQTALEYELLMIRRRKMAFLPGDPVFDVSYYNLSVTYRYLGNHDKALEYYLQSSLVRGKHSINKCPSSTNEFSRRYAGKKRKIGSVSTRFEEYARCNHPAKKQELLQDKKLLDSMLNDLEICEKVFPPQDPSLITSYSNISLAFEHMGNYEKALQYGLKAIHILESIQPLNQKDLGTMYNNLGNLYGYLSQPDQALSCLEKSHKLRISILPAKHPSVATSYNNLGYLYSENGNHRQALKYFEKALTIRQEVLPEGHEYILQTRRNIAYVKRMIQDEERLNALV